MSWLVCAYYTGSGIYRDCMSKLVQSMIAHNIPYEITHAPDQGSWQANTQYKPKFLRGMLEKHHPKSVVYVDADATFEAYPALFDDLDAAPGPNIAVYILDHSKFTRKCKPEMLSGTVFLKNTPETGIIIDEWIKKCELNPGVWDQVALSMVLQHHGYGKLPARYCCIVDYMKGVPNKVIVHHQASRIVKRQPERAK